MFWLLMVSLTYTKQKYCKFKGGKKTLDTTNT